MAKNKYLMRHDKVCIHLHYSICKSLGNENTDKWHTHIPKPVCEDGNVTVLWDQAVYTDREIRVNRPDIIIKDKKEKTCTLIDMATPEDSNVVQKEWEKKLKYKSLCIEKQRIWNVKCTNVTAIVGEKLKEIFGNSTRKTLVKFTTKDSYTWNITYNTESTAV